MEGGALPRSGVSGKAKTAVILGGLVSVGHSLALKRLCEKRIIIVMTGDSLGRAAHLPYIPLAMTHGPRTHE